MILRKVLFLFLLFIPLCFAEHEGELGYCALCDTEILERVDKFHLRQNEEYSEVWFLLSNNSVAKIGFCKKHAENLTEKDFSKIMQGVRNGWINEFKTNNWSREQVEEYTMNFFTLSIVRRLDEKEIPVYN